MPKRSRRIAAGLGIVGAAALAMWALWPSPAIEGADAGDRRQVALGEAIYRQHCASCHGAKLEGQANWRDRKADGRLPAPPHDQTGHTWHHSDAQLFALTKHGLKPPHAPAGYQSDMPAYEETLTDRQIWAVLAYIKSKWPPEIQIRQSRTDAASQRAR